MATSHPATAVDENPAAYLDIADAHRPGVISGGAHSLPVELEDPELASFTLKTCIDSAIAS